MRAIARREDRRRMTYFVALRFIARDDGVAAGEPIECLSPAAVVMRAEALPGHTGAVAFSREGRSGHGRLRRCEDNREIRRSAG